MKVKRVQKYVETLDMLKMKNSTPTSSSGNVASSVRSHKPRQASRFAQEQVSSGGGGERNSVGQAAAADQQHSAQSSRHSSSSGSVVITTQWETFDSAVPVPVPPSASSSSTASAQPRFNWDLL